MDTRPGEATLLKIYLLPSVKGSTLKGKNLLSLGPRSKSFTFSVDLFTEGIGVQELKGKKEDTKFVSLKACENGEKL